MESFECEGIWWLPNDEKKICGKLKFDSQDGAELKTIGFFKSEMESLDLKRYGIILGSTDKGLMTLVNTIETHSGAGSFYKSSLYVQIILKGHLFEKKEDMKFKNVSFSFLNLEEWANLNGIHRELGEDFPVFYFKSPQPITTTVQDLGISIRFLGYNKTTRFNAEIGQETVFVIENINGIDLNDFIFNIGNQIRNFLTLGMGNATFPLEIQTLTIDDKDVNIYYRTNSFNRTYKKILNHEMFFSLNDISNFEMIMKNWLINYDKLRPVYSAYFGTITNSKMFLEQEFLSLIQALESYHRRMIGGEYMDEKDYSAHTKNLYLNIPPEFSHSHKDSLKNRIKYGYEYSLRKRLKELLGKYNTILNPIISVEKDFIEDVVNTRNYFTHLTEEGKKSAVTEILELNKLTVKIKFLLEICFLEELGFEFEKIQELTLRDRRYDYIKKSND